MSDRLFCIDENDRQRQYKQRCQEIVEEVRRHVDNIGHVSIESDQSDVCEHCGSAWTEESNEYNGGCCEKDQAAEDDRQKLLANALADELGFPSIRKEG